MKSRVKKRVIALMLCMVMVLSSGISTLAEGDAGTPEATEEVSSTNDESAVNTEPDTAVAEDAQSRSNTAVETETAAEENAPAEAEAQPKTAEAAPAENTEADAAIQSNDTTMVEGEEQQAEVYAESTGYTYETVVDGVTIIATTENTDVLPRDAEFTVTKIEKDEELSEIETAITPEAIEQQKAIESIMAYDVKFYSNGTEIQPNGKVRVEFKNTGLDNTNGIAVYHVDEEANTATDMAAVEGTESGSVAFDTTHFSTYVIVQEGTDEVTVTLEHYDDATKQPIYSKDVKTLPVGGSISDYRKAINYDVSRVVEVTDGGRETAVEDINEIRVSSNKTFRIYYKASTKTTEGEVIFYDYQIHPGWNKVGINDDSHYSRNDNWNNRLTVGTKEKNAYPANQYNAFGSNDLNANNCNYKDDTGGFGTLGLIQGLSDDFKDVIWNVGQPGLFTEEDKGEGKDVYRDYTLKFSQTGNQYVLEEVYHDGQRTAKAGSNFFPIDNPTWDSDGKNGEYYFGMRYDVEFTLGDYVGPLEYTFTGDDDLWVLLDGEVVLDIGGIHDAITGSVDLWPELGFKDGARPTTAEEKNEVHRITVLYMERGAGESNCTMNFTLPEARIVDVNQVPTADITLNKVNTKNEALDGASFRLVNDANENEIYTSTSGTDGTVTFEKLREGTYTLTETSAPNGYIAEPNKTWKVIVTVDDETETATATLYESDGITAVSDNKITNYTSTELAKKNIETSKTVHVTDWNDREYQIDISAASKVTSSTSVSTKAVIDVMFVFDLSASMNGNATTDNVKMEKIGSYSNVKDKLDITKTYYFGDNMSTTSGWGDFDSADNPMRYIDGKWQYYSEDYWGGYWTEIDKNSTKNIYEWDSRITALKEAASSFAITTADQSPDSKIGIITFSSSGYGKNDTVHSLQTVGSGEPVDLLEDINSLLANGGTSPQSGLKAAKDALDKAGDTNDKYVILFSDGAPSESDDTEESETAADNLKNAGYKVITIGFGLSDNEYVPGTGGYGDRGDTTSEWLENEIASPDMAYTADTTEELLKLFEDIQSSIMQTYDITGAEIVDVIDSRFELAEGEKKRLEETGATVTVNEDGTTTVKWTNQTIPYKKTDDTKWSQTINIVAKEDYIGGNAVETNVTPDSAIHTGYGDVILDQPTVNVKVDLDVSNKKVTIYKGDVIPTEEALLESLFGTNYIGKYGVEADDFTWLWDTDTDFSNGVTTEQIKDITPQSSTTYYLQVTYNAGEPTDESNENTTLNKQKYWAGTENASGDYIVAAKNTGLDVDDPDNTEFNSYENALYGVFKIEVISGQIKINKIIHTPENGDQTFTFTVTDKETQEVYTTQTITISSGQTTAANPIVIDELPRGTYVVTENVSGYVITDIQVDDSETNCQSTSPNTEAGTVEFVMGTSKAGENVIKNYTYDSQDGGTVGYVTYTNAKVLSAEWQFKKVSTTGNEITLSGAKFKLEETDINQGESPQIYYGQSGNDGTIRWYTNEACSGTAINNSDLESGTYILEEISAPSGYILSEETWTIEISSSGILSIDSSEEENIGFDTDPETGMTIFYFTNEVLYDLPESGGSGIYWYMLGGVLLMMAGSLLVYKKRRGEVLRRK